MQEVARRNSMWICWRSSFLEGQLDRVDGSRNIWLEDLDGQREEFALRPGLVFMSPEKWSSEKDLQG